MAGFHHDGLWFNYRESGEGVPFVYQHGLGGDVNQPFDLFKPPGGFRLLAFDFRGHGETRPLGPENKLSLASLADDLFAFLEQLHLAKAIAGGISMGAAVALNFTLHYPERVIGLVLSRPAWLDARHPENLSIYLLVADYIRRYGAAAGMKYFEETPRYAELRRQSPSAAASVLGQFQNARAEETVAKLERIPNDAPNFDREEWRGISVPTLVLANQHDPVHPFDYGRELARLIPGAEFHEITSKAISLERHRDDHQRHLGEFLTRNLPTWTAR